MADIKNFLGTLILSDRDCDMNRMNYCVKDFVDGKLHSITDELERIYNSNNDLVRIALRILDNNHIINKKGRLHKGLDKHGVLGWFIDGLEFDRALDELNFDGNRDIEIFVEDFIIDKVTTSTDTMEDGGHVS